MSCKLTGMLCRWAGVILSACILMHSAQAAFLENNTNLQTAAGRMTADENAGGETNIYVAKDNSVQQLFHVLGGVMSKPIVVSTLAARKRISGNFDLNDPALLLQSVALKTGLIWYDDGSSVYIYDDSEVQSRVVGLSFAPFSQLLAYLKSTGLYDTRFPPRAEEGSGAFYISGPPVYVSLVSAAAHYIDTMYSGQNAGEDSIRVIKLHNAFVSDRTYTQRDKPVTVPGVATVLNQLLNNGPSLRGGGKGRAVVSVDGDTLRSMNVSRHGNNDQQEQGEESLKLPLLGTLPAASSESADERAGERMDNPVSIVAYSDTNSLLVRGPSRQVRFVEGLITALDISKEQIQLSLWIIDISKENVDELGIRWEAAARSGNNGFTFNTSSLEPDSSFHFLAQVSALAKKGDAQIVSRPEVLTQDNVPALFDNNSSFYSSLVGERTASLEKITYGTIISVLPRLSEGRAQREIEMVLDIQDGGLPVDDDGKTVEVNNLPVVTNTQISTQARVPEGNSLLVGGYDREQNERYHLGIPGLRDIPYLGRLFDYSYTSRKNMVRLFLIQPRLLDRGEVWRGQHDANPVIGRDVKGGKAKLKETVSMLQRYNDGR